MLDGLLSKYTVLGIEKRVPYLTVNLSVQGRWIGQGTIETRECLTKDKMNERLQTFEKG